MHYIWQKENWHHFTWRTENVIDLLGAARKKQGIILGKSGFLDLNDISRFVTEEALNTAEIEGEMLDRDSVRSSVARRLGLPTAGLPAVRREIDGLVQILMDAVSGYAEPLNQERLYAWQAALFPTGYSGIQKILTGAWRTSFKPMQVLSGSMGNERIHFEAPPAVQVSAEMSAFLHWWNNESYEIDGIIRAAVAHFRFVTIHPFEDGNGRIARALTDMAIARDERTGKRLYSLSSRINKEKTVYYDVLEITQKGKGDITAWLCWFLQMYCRSIDDSLKIIEGSIFRSTFYRRLDGMGISERQKKVIGKLTDVYPEGFAGGLTNKKYVSMTKVSPETAKRDIRDLLEKGVLIKNDAQGRSTSYRLNYQIVE